MVLQFFDHDIYARDDEKIIELMSEFGWEGYGLFWGIIENLCKVEALNLQCKWKAIAYNLRTSEEIIRHIVCDFGLFEIDEKENTFNNVRISNKFMKVIEISAKRSKSARKRWDESVKECESKANAMQMQSNSTVDIDRERENNPKGAHACMREGEGASISEQGAVVFETYVEFTEANHMAVPEKFNRFKCDISTHTAAIADTLSQILGRAIAKKDVLEFLAKAFSDKLYQNNWSLDFLAKRAVQIHNIKQPKEPEQPNNILPEGVEWVNESRKIFSYIAEDGTRKENRLGQNEFFHNGRRTYKPEKYDFPDNGNEKFRFPPLWAKPRPLTSDVTFWNGEDWYGRP